MNARQVVENTLLLAWGRISMALLLPTLALLGMWMSATFASKAEVAIIKQDTAVLQSNSLRGRQDREDFQEQTSARLDRIGDQITNLTSSIAALTATIEAQQRQLDRKR